MKKSKLSAKLEKFYSNTESLREYLKWKNRQQMRLQTDQEFNKNVARILLGREGTVENFYPFLELQMNDDKRAIENALRYSGSL